ncbi:MAG: hypothetical protein U0271_36250 [Polyangiaceae bacterium]
MFSSQTRGSPGVAVAALLFVGCGGARAEPPCASAAAPTSSTTAQAAASASASASAAPASSVPNVPASYAALFADLVARIERHHVFADAAKSGWPARKAQLEKEFSRVHTREEALVALAHLENALGDRHCSLSPPTDLRQGRLGLGLALFAERVEGGAVRVRVSEVLDKDLATGSTPTVAEGDEVVAVDGVPVATWLEAHPFESNSLNPTVVLFEQANAIVRARLPWSTIKKGDKRKLTLSRAGANHDVELAFVHPGKWEDAIDVDFDEAPAMSSIGCRNDQHTLYSDFELSAVGVNLCVYKPKKGDKAGKADTRLVRFLSFAYGINQASDDGLRAAKADHDLLTRELAKAKAVVLDVHENHGGNNPFVFLSWFAKSAWDHQQIHLRVSPEFSEDDVRSFVFGDSAMTTRYLELAKRGEGEVSFPFLCMADGKPVTEGTCEGRGPRASELVSSAPVAIVTGPECTSSCDSIVADWSAFDLGPLVGQQPAHGFTTIRHSYALVDPDGRDLGRFRIALSWEAYPRNNQPLEGRPVELDWEAPSTFETRNTWVDASVREARRRAESLGR